LDNAVLLTEEADIRKAKAGPDVHCPYCRARNPADAEFCGACGGSLGEAEAREHGRVIGAFREERGLEKECPNCGTLNTAGALECSGCGGSLVSSPEPQEREGEAAGPKRRGLPRFAGIGCLAIVLIGIAFFVFSLLSKEQVTATVQQVEWERSVPILALAPVHNEDWRDQVPGDAEELSCREELRETNDEPVPGAVEVCGTPYTIDEGSGYGEVVQDCVYEVYDDYCSYTVMDWAVIDTLTVSGADLDPYWPDAPLQAGQEKGEGESQYLVIFDVDGDRLRYHPDDESDFSRFTPGSSWVIEVNKLGGISVVEPTR
jgi:hypothetical protein